MSDVYWFVAAGTGGHIFPGLNLAAAMRVLNPKAQFLFFGTADRLEAKIIPENGYPIRFLRAAKWKNSGLVSKILGVLTITVGFFQAVGTFFKSRPDCLISVGGYVSVPVALACILFRVPYLIVEPNIRAGLANRMLSRFAVAAFTVPGSDAAKLFKCPVFDFGNPVRQDLKPTELRPTVRKILVLGGSQGALSLCKASLELAKNLKMAGSKIELVLQCGEKNLEQSVALQKQWGLEDVSKIYAFIKDVPQVLAGADVVIARAGAMTVAELAVAGLPTIFVPFPFAADNHQAVNAELYAQDGAALVVDERSPDFAKRLADSVHSLCLGPGAEPRRRALSEKIKIWGRPQAAKSIAQQVLSISEPRV